MNGKAKKGLAQIQDTVGQSHGYLSSFAINIFYPIRIYRHKNLVAIIGSNLEEHILGSVVDTIKATDGLAGIGIDNHIAYYLRQRHFASICRVGKTTREEDSATCDVASLLLSVDTFKLHESCLVATKTIYLEEERYEDAIYVKKQIVGIHTGEDVVVEISRHLAFHTMRLTYGTYFIYVVSLNHRFLIF